MSEIKSHIGRTKSEILTSRVCLVLAVVLVVPAILLPLLWFLVLGLVIGGSVVSQRWRCNHCGNRTDRRARICATCGARFQ